MALQVDNINIMLCLYWASLLNLNEITLSFCVFMNVFAYLLHKISKHTGQ